MTSVRDWDGSATPAAVIEARVLALLGVALLLFGTISQLNGPETLQQNHIEMGRALLWGDPRTLVTPAYPIFGYALIIALLGPWTLLLNIAAGFLAFAWVFRELDLGRREPPVTFYLATLAYAALVASWNDHAPLLSLLLASVAFLHRYGARDWRTGAVVGLLWGLAYNMRTDALLLFPIFALASLAQCRLTRRSWALAHHAAAALVFLAAMVPWGIYTTNVLGKYTPTSTNGWGVVYLGLGLVPDNRHDLKPRDEHLGEKVKVIGEASPWSAPSNAHFRQEVVRIVSSDPGLAVKKMAWGFVHALRIGSYAPDLREAAATSPEDYLHLHTAFQNLKRMLGLPANYQGTPPASISVSTRDAAILLADLALRIVFGLTFLIVGAQCLLLLRNADAVPNAGPIAAVALAVALYWCLVAVLLFPIDRLNAVVLTFGALLLQRMSVCGLAGQGARDAPSLERAGLGAEPGRLLRWRGAKAAPAQQPGSGMHILFLTDNFPPEVNAPASRTYEHCREWVRCGHRVTVITCAPNFPSGRVFAGYRNRLWSRETMDGIDVIRVWTIISANSGFLLRTIDYASFMLSAVPAALLVRGVDLIVATSPQLFTPLAAWMASRLKRRPYVFELRDLWPESIRAVGAMRSSRVLDALERLELFLYRKAAHIVSVTDSFRHNLIARGIPADKISVTKNGADLTRFQPRPRDAGLALQLGLGERTVVGYVGTHGMAHGLSTVLSAAALVQEAAAQGDAGAASLQFLFLGDGAEKEALKAEAAARSLGNVTFLDSVPRSEVARYWSLIDIAVIHLKKTPLFTTVIPSKLFECMAMGIPVLHGVAGESAQIVEREGNGVTFEPENAEALAAAVRALAADPARRAELARNGVEAAKRYDRTNLARQMLESLRKVGKTPAAAGLSVSREQTG